MAKRIKLGMLKDVSMLSTEAAPVDGLGEAMHEAMASETCQLVELTVNNVQGLGDLDAMFAGGAALEQTLRIA